MKHSECRAKLFRSHIKEALTSCFLACIVCWLMNWVSVKEMGGLFLWALDLVKIVLALHAVFYVFGALRALTASDSYIASRMKPARESATRYEAVLMQCNTCASRPQRLDEDIVDAEFKVIPPASRRTGS